MSAAGQILVLNCGSSSVKFGLFSADRGLRRLASGAIERVGLPEGRLEVRDAGGCVLLDVTVEVADHDQALELLLDRFQEFAGAGEVAAVGHRVVHGGADCDCPLHVDQDVLERLRSLIPLVPLHQPHNLAGIEAVARRRPDLPQVACFDTAFHRSMPRVAQMTGLPRQMEAYGMRRYGFHGLSYESILDQLVESEGEAVKHERIIVAHLGNGASMAAIRDGKSVETTMGFSSLAGLLMGSRCGDLDPGLVLYLLDELGLDSKRVARLLYEESGLAGVSGVSRNMRELLGQRDRPEVSEAIDLFCYRARCYVGSLTAVLGGLDRLVFTGGIGANAPEIRETICAGLDHLGIELDARRNRSGARTVSPDEATVTVQVLTTDEERVIARHTQRVALEQREPAHA